MIGTPDPNVKIKINLRFKYYRRRKDEGLSTKRRKCLQMSKAFPVQIVYWCGKLMKRFLPK